MDLHTKQVDTAQFAQTLGSDTSEPHYNTVSQVSFSVGGNSLQNRPNHVQTFSSVVNHLNGDDRSAGNRRQITLDFSCIEEQKPPDIHVMSFNSSELNAHRGSSLHPRQNIPTGSQFLTTNNRRGVDLNDKSGEFDLPFIHTSSETQNLAYDDNKLSPPVNNTGKPYEDKTTVTQPHTLHRAQCVLQTRRHDNNEDNSMRADRSQAHILFAADHGPQSNYTTNQPTQFHQHRTIVKPSPLYHGNTGTVVKTLSSSSGRDKVNIGGFSSPLSAGNVERDNNKCRSASGYHNDNSERSVSARLTPSPIHVSIGGLCHRGAEDEYAANLDNGVNITDYGNIRQENSTQNLPTVLTITPSSPRAFESGDRNKSYTLIRGLETSTNAGITELRISSSCASKFPAGERSTQQQNSMETTNNNPCMDGSRQSVDKNEIQSARIFKPIPHEDSVGSVEEIQSRLVAHERTLASSSSSSAPTTPSFPKPFIQCSSYDTAKQKFLQNAQGANVRSHEGSNMAKLSCQNSCVANVKPGGVGQCQSSGKGGGSFGAGSPDLLKPLGVSKLAKVSKKSLQSFEEFTPTSSPTASRRSSISSQDLSDATNEVKVLLSRNINAGDPAGHNVRVSAVQLPKKTNTFRQSSLEGEVRVSAMETGGKLNSPNDLKNISGLRTDFSAFRLHVSPISSPKSVIRTHTTSAPSSPVRSLQGLTIKMKETPPVSTLLSPRDKRPFSPMSEPAEDQGCVPDIQDELENETSQTLPRNYHRRIRPKTAPSVPTAFLREVTSVEKELRDKGSLHKDRNSPLKFSFQPINMKVCDDTSSDSDPTILPHGKLSGQGRRRKKSGYTGQSTDSSESNGESNGRSKSDPTQDRNRTGLGHENIFEKLQDSHKGQSSSSIVSAESALSLSSANTTLSDPNVDDSFDNAYEESLNETEGSICSDLHQTKNMVKSHLKQKSMTWPNGDKSENDLAEYCTDKINTAVSAPVVSEVDNSPEEGSASPPRNRSPVLMPKQQSLTDTLKRRDSFSETLLDQVRHKRSTSEPVPVAADLLARSDSSTTDRQLPTLTVTTSQESGPKRPERKKPIIASIQGSKFLQPEPLEDQLPTSGSTPDLRQAATNSRMGRLMMVGSCATLPRAASTSKVGELSPKTKLKKKKENLKQHVMTTLLETEKSYVQSLEALIKRYQRPLKSAEYAGICDAGIVDAIFYKIPEIHQNHENFLQQLEMGIDNKHTIPKIAALITNAFSKQPVLDAYTAFTNNFDHAKDLITKASHKLAFTKFLEERTKESKERLHMADLIIQPVQRIPRYELLLKDLIDNTPPDHEDRESLQTALDTVKRLAIAVDESKNLADNARKDEQALRELEGLIDGVDLVSPHRKFVRQYAITEMKGGKKERCLFLFSDMIICASVKRRSGGLRRPSVTVLLPIEASKYKLAWKVHLEDVEILKSTPNAKRANQERDLGRLEEDLAILNRISGLSETLNCSHVVLDDTIKELIDSVGKKIAEHQALTSLPISPLNKVELSVTSPEGIETVIIFFHNTESRVSFENEVADAKKKLAASSRNHFPPVFLDAIPVMKTRSGMQFSCASPSLGTINDSLREVWVCNSDGYVGQVCLLNLNPEPTVAFCISLCSARILCIAAVPGTQEHPNGRSKLRTNNTPFHRSSPQPVKPPSFTPVSMGNSSEASEIMAFDSDDSEEEDVKITDLTDGVELNVLSVEENAKESDPEDDGEDRVTTSLEEAQSDFEVYQPTMWLGTEDCCIHVYQCTDNLRTKKSRAKIRHPAAVQCILHIDNKVFVALANGDLTVYKREIGQSWDTNNPITVTLGSSTTPITKMVAVKGKLWCGCQNNILIVDPYDLNIQHQFSVCNDNQRAVYCMVSSGWGVWVSLQSSAVVRLFHATTYESLCNVDVTQTVHKMLAGSDAIIRQHKAACLRITALLVCRDLLWMGTSAGVVLTLPLPKLGISSTPLKETPTATGSNQGHTGHVRFLSFVDLNNTFSNNNNASKRITIPKVGERPNDVLIEGAVTNHEDRRKSSGSSGMLVISGGDGYEDFGTTAPNELAGKEDSTNHLLLWHV